MSADIKPQSGSIGWHAFPETSKGHLSAPFHRESMEPPANPCFPGERGHCLRPRQYPGKHATRDSVIAFFKGGFVLTALLVPFTVLAQVQAPARPQFVVYVATGDPAKGLLKQIDEQWTVTLEGGAKVG